MMERGLCNGELYSGSYIGPIPITGWTSYQTLPRVTYEVIFIQPLNKPVLNLIPEELRIYHISTIVGNRKLA